MIVTLLLLLLLLLVPVIEPVDESGASVAENTATGEPETELNLRASSPKARGLSAVIVGVPLSSDMVAVIVLVTVPFTTSCSDARQLVTPSDLQTTADVVSTVVDRTNSSGFDTCTDMRLRVA